jgi:protein TonB
MFDQFVGENTARTRRPLAVGLSFTGQVVLVGLTVIFPLLRTEAIVPDRPTHFIPVLRPWGGSKQAPQKPADAHATAKPGLTVVSEHAFREPAFVPARIALVDGPSVGALAAGPGGYGMPDGVIGAVSTDMIPPLKPEPPPVVPQSPAVPPRVTIGGRVQAAKVINQVTPVYPPIAKQARISGVVRLEAIIGRDGRIESLHVTSGPPLLVEAAIAAVRQWVYRPTFLNGVPVEVLTQIEVHFKLAE